jgi:outer membrane lipopolysaccharide assembly protein LptE/RlpB
VTAALLLPLFGCAYQSSLEKSPPSYGMKEPGQGVHSPIGSQMSRILIPVFQNRTFEPLIEDVLTRRFHQQVLLDGHLKLVADRDQADMILIGDLISFGQTPLSLDINNAALEYRIVLNLRLTLIDAKTKKVLWQKPSTAGNADYYVNVDATLNRAALDRAIDEASKDLAEDVLSEILDLYR